MPPLPHFLGHSITALALLTLACDGETAVGAMEPLLRQVQADLVVDRAPAPQLAMSAAAASHASACAKVKAVKVADSSRTCDWDGSGKKPLACAKWSPSLSDRCLAESSHGSGVSVDLGFFGQVDCRSSRRDHDVRRIVIHNGDHAANNNDNWKCRPSAAHYTIDRDGQIYQHMGEERAAWHANTENDDTIGIEIAIKRKYKGTCNSLPDLDKVAAAQGIATEDVVADLCGPTAAQYTSLANLIADIKTRHTIDEGGVFGHCEIKASEHGDPKAFDWHAIGLPARKPINACKWYHVAAVKGVVVSSMAEGAGARIFMSAGVDVEVGDHGYLEDSNEDIKMWFTVDKVQGLAAAAWVSMTPAQALGKSITVVATPGKTPKPLASKATGATTSAKPALGSCDTDYTYWKGGKIKSWTKRGDGSVDTLTLENLGWKHRVCDDSSGMIYVGESGDAYVTDGEGKKIRFRMKSVDETAAIVEVFEGALDLGTLGSHRRVVVRVKK